MTIAQHYVPDYSSVTAGLQEQVVQLEFYLKHRKLAKARELVERIQGQLNIVILSTYEIENEERRVEEIRELYKAIEKRNGKIDFVEPKF